MKPSISKRIILDELFKAAFWSFVGHHHQTSMVKLDHHHWSEPLVTRISDQVLGYVFLWSRSLLRVLGSQLWLSPCLEIQKTFFLSISLSREGNPENQHLLQFVFSSMTFLFAKGFILLILSIWILHLRCHFEYIVLYSFYFFDFRIREVLENYKNHQKKRKKSLIGQD